MVEPLGILSGYDAAASVLAGKARWLAGGPSAFTLMRQGEQVAAVNALPPMWESIATKFSAPVADWAGLGPGPHVMGILNVTPDSFSDGGDHLDTRAAIKAGEQMLIEGASIVDVGGESTRPGATPVDASVEQARVLFVVRALVQMGAVVSIDTRNAGTMARALDEGARIVNDVTALAHDPAALPLVVARACPVVLMHMRGTPETMKSLATYGNVAAEVVDELSIRVITTCNAGVAQANIAIDPGFGFAKDAEQSLTLLQHLSTLCVFGCPLLVGISRKATIGMLTSENDPKRRGAGSLAATLFALARGARVLRVHDVAETVQAVKVWSRVAT